MTSSLKPITLSLYHSVPNLCEKSAVTLFHEFDKWNCRSHSSGADFFILFENNDKLLYLNNGLSGIRFIQI